MAVPTESEVNRWLGGYIERTFDSGRLSEIVTEFDGAILRSVPRLADLGLRRDLSLSTTAQVRALMTHLSLEAGQVILPPEAHGLARAIARQGLDLGVLMQAYRAGLQAGIAYMTRAIQEEGLHYEFEREVVVRIFDRSSNWIGVSLEMLTDTYIHERESGLRDRFTRRAETVRQILDGEDIAPEDASRALGYLLQRNHIGFVLWSADDDAGALDGYGNRVARALGATAAITVPAGPRSLWGWASVDADPDLAAVRGSAPDFGGMRVRVALGTRAGGVAGFRGSHREALAAQRVAGMSRRSDWLTAYSDVELVHLASADIDGMRALVARELAGIDGADANAERLRATLRAYLSAHRSPDTAARALGVHKNTVRYRLQRIEELLGHTVDERRLPLEVALACEAVFDL